MQDLLIIGVGGFAGACCRYLVAQWAAAQVGITFPWGTLLINVSGSFLLAVLLGWGEQHGGLDPRIRLLIAVGFFGAYTTFSTFATESAGMITRGDWGPVIAYVVGSNTLCILGALAGLNIGNRL